jgi:hypothetical protein
MKNEDIISIEEILMEAQAVGMRNEVTTLAVELVKENYLPKLEAVETAYQRLIVEDK